MQWYTHTSHSVTLTSWTKHTSIKYLQAWATCTGSDSNSFNRRKRADNLHTRRLEDTSLFSAYSKTESQGLRATQTPRSCIWYGMVWYGKLDRITRTYLDYVRVTDREHYVDLVECFIVICLSCINLHKFHGDLLTALAILVILPKVHLTEL